MKTNIIIIISIIITLAIIYILTGSLIGVIKVLAIILGFAIVTLVKADQLKTIK